MYTARIGNASVEFKQTLCANFRISTIPTIEKEHVRMRVYFDGRVMIVNLHLAKWFSGGNETIRNKRNEVFSGQSEYVWKCMY